MVNGTRVCRICTSPMANDNAARETLSDSKSVEKTPSPTPSQDGGEGPSSSSAVGYQNIYTNYYTNYVDPRTGQVISSGAAGPSVGDPTAATDYYTMYTAQQESFVEAFAPEHHNAKRASNQMHHYFDAGKYVESLGGKGRAKPDVPKRLSKKQVEAFKKRKEERKKIRNRWLFE